MRLLLEVVGDLPATSSARRCGYGDLDPACQAGQGSAVILGSDNGACVNFGTLSPAGRRDVAAWAASAFCPATVESLRRTASKLAESIQSVDLLDAPVVVDEIVAQLRPVDVRRMATELEFATERIRQVVEDVRPDGLKPPVDE